MKAVNSYKKKQTRTVKKPGKTKKIPAVAFFALLLVSALGIAWYTFSSPSSSSSGSSGAQLTQEPVSEALFHYPDHFSMRSQYLDQFVVHHHVIERGDTIHGVMEKFNLPMALVAQWQRACVSPCRLNEIHPGDQLTVRVSLRDQTPIEFNYSPVNGNAMTFRRVGDEWKCREQSNATYTIIQSASGTIVGNLYDSCIGAGISPNLIMELADLFAYDIDFNTDLREGDTFAIHFREEVKDGRCVRRGPILAAKMVVSGKTHSAFYHETGDGKGSYFDSEGESLRKMFLRAPLSYRRISSTFTHRRFHPVLKIYRPHYGIDYAAPEGTPVSALGSGTVTFKGWRGGYGNFVEIRHNDTYKTTYGHLSRYASGLRRGSRVEQGEVIGYVGATGVATGPHLDFRFYKNGTPIDFLKTEFPHAESVPKSQMAAFLETRDGYLAALRGEDGLPSRRVVLTASK